MTNILIIFNSVLSVLKVLLVAFYKDEKLRVFLTLLKVSWRFLKHTGHFKKWLDGIKNALDAIKSVKCLIIFYSVENIENEITIRVESLIEEIQKYRNDFMLQLKKYKQDFEKY